MGCHLCNSGVGCHDEGTERVRANNDGVQLVSYGILVMAYWLWHIRYGILVMAYYLWHISYGSKNDGVLRRVADSAAAVMRIVRRIVP